MHQYRVTKYDPRYRKSSGAFTRDDWICVGDIGSTFSGTVLTASEYLAVENAYVASALAFLAETGVESLAICSFENHGSYANSELSLDDGRECSLLEVADIARLNLRSSIWCRLVADNAFLHFGYDYYMYVGVPTSRGVLACSLNRLNLRTSKRETAEYGGTVVRR
ncbi:MAG: hypothetical protein IH987_12435 [Planctomycetes bacterium]|nr:hypothetical protein [Planctomycetota bacterium]